MPGLFARIAQKAQRIGPDPNMQVREAGMPSPGKNLLWQIMNTGRQSMPQMQELTKYLPLAPDKSMFTKGVESMPAMLKALLARSVNR